MPRLEIKTKNKTCFKGMVMENIHIAIFNSRHEVLYVNLRPREAVLVLVYRQDVKVLALKLSPLVKILLTADRLNMSPWYGTDKNSQT